MTTHFRHAIATVALVTLGAGTAAAQAVIVQEPVESRTVVRESLNLSPAQRTTIYRTIVPQGRGKQPIIRERVVTETMGSGAAVRDRVVVDPAPRERVVIDQWGRERIVDQPRERIIVDQWGRERAVTAPTEVDYVVGDRIPATVQLSAFPDRIVREVPAMSGYRYMTVNNRVLVIDPATSTVVQEIDR
jgi:hypothetical protein